MISKHIKNRPGLVISNTEYNRAKNCLSGSSMKRKIAAGQEISIEKMGR